MVWARADLPGFHFWPDAPPHRHYLAQEHRHLFRVEVAVEVRHDDRDLEFHDLLDVVREWWAEHAADSTGAVAWGSASCERIAGWLAAHLRERGLLDRRAWRVTVAEDDESGATISEGA